MVGRLLPPVRLAKILGAIGRTPVRDQPGVFTFDADDANGDRLQVEMPLREAALLRDYISQTLERLQDMP